MAIRPIAAGAIAASACAALPSAVLACSSCGCTLNSDWASQGFKADGGWSVDLRHDYFSQTDLRRGSGRVDRASIALPADEEIQQKTINRITNLTLDYGVNADWGVALVLPYVSRFHTTIAEGDGDVSTSRSGSAGDVRVIGRFQGFTADHDWGLQLGLKLPTGNTHVSFSEGPQTGEPLDRGLQPGTGTTDLLLGAYTFGSLGPSVDYFAQALLQLPLRAKDEFKPGTGANLSAGLRYVSGGPIVPHLQINARIEGRESGANADVPNSGATLVYLSPGATATLSDRLKLYAFVQLPVYQRVNGLQLEPKLSVSVGLHYGF